MLQLVLLGGKYDKHDVVVFNAPSKDMKDKWLSLLWRLSVEGEAYSRNMGKYYLHVRGCEFTHQLFGLTVAAEKTRTAKL